MDLADQRHDLYVARMQRTRQFMRAAGVPVMLILDPVNIFYATGTRNMELFTTRTPARYLLVIEPGPTILFEYFGCEHLPTGSPTVTEIRTAEGLCQISSGGDAAGAAKRMAAEVAAVIRDCDQTIDRIAIDRFPYLVIDALRVEGFRLTDSDDVLLAARAVKLPIEIPFMREAMARVEMAVERFEQAIGPGRTEAEVWAELYGGLIAAEGQYICTRLMQSGPKTFPYFQECGNRVLKAGDLVCLDTDAIGYEGYGVDFSRTFLCGDGAASSDQRCLYGRAREQLEHNAALLRPGIEYVELATKAWSLPEEHQASRYYCVGHGLGLAGEFPNIPHAVSGHPYPLVGRIEPGMVICVESYVGSADSAQGVKLEDQFLILDDGVERMSAFHFDQRLG
jgi:Xaa-Pro aminopeptidase